MKRIVLILAVLATLAFPGAAPAEDLTEQWLIRQDMAIALGYWHRPGPCHSYVVETGPTPFLAETELGACTQRWNAELWQWFAEAVHAKQSPQRTEYLRWSCVLFTHEYGHTLGLPDETSNPRGIMYRASMPGRVPVPGCRHAFG